MANSRPKVVVVSNRLGSFGGGERWVCEMAARLKEKLELSIINPISDKDVVRMDEERLSRLFNIKDIKVTRLKCLGIRHRFHGNIDLTVLLPTLHGLAALNDAVANSDVVYELSFNPFILFWSMFFAGLHGKRFILGLHNPDFLVGESGKKSGIFGRIMQRILLKCVKEMHVQTKSQMSLLLKAGYSGKKYYIPHYLYFRISEKDANSYGKDFDVLLTGRLSVYQKGIDLLEKIVEETLSKDKKVHFTIIGSGEGGGILKLLEKKHKANVSYLGFVSDYELKKRYMKSSLFILTSRYETPGLSLLEAQSYGMPAIAFDVMGPRDIMTKNVQGELIKPFDTDKFADRIISFKGKFTDREGYRRIRIEIWSTINKRYDESAFVNKFEEMIKG
jgi:glycosyltransferase involved in cell wall biosynthesis